MPVEKNVARLMLLSIATAVFAALSGATAWIVLRGLFEVKGSELAILVGLASTAGAAVAGIFGQGLFTSALSLLLAKEVPPMPDGPELETWRKWLQNAALEKRVRGGESQRDLMLRGGKVMDVTVSGDLDIVAGREGKPHIHSDGRRGPFSTMVEQWDVSGGRLVILGDPGYGKTFAALSLIDHINHTTGKVADLFPLIDWYTWAGGGLKGRSIELWLVEQMRLSYPELSVPAARAIVANGDLIPIFDGLDELPEAARPSCRDALEAYAGYNAPFRSFVVTCRQDEYMELRPRWVGADHTVALLGLSREEIEATIQASVANLGQWGRLLDALRGEDEKLLALLRSPLRLTAAIEVFEHRDPYQLLSLSRAADASEQLWDLLLQSDSHIFPEANRGDVRDWLSFLAASMRSHNRQRFWLHELYLYTYPKDVRRFRLAATLAFIAIAATPLLLHRMLPLTLGAAIIAVAALFSYRRRRDEPLVHTVRKRASPRAYLRNLPMSGLAGLLSGVFWTVATAPIVMLALAVGVSLEGETLDVGKAAEAAIQIAARSGIIVAALVATMNVLDTGSTEVDEEPPDHFIGRGPGAVIRSTLTNSLLAAGVAGLVVGIPIEIAAWGTTSVWTSLATIVLVAWISGLDAWSYYHWARLRLARRGKLPRRLRRFLDWAAHDAGWLRASDAYEFRHRELLDYLAKSGEPVGAANLSRSEALLAKGHDKAALVILRHGNAMAKAGDLEGARDSYRAAVEIAPGDSLFRRALAGAHERLGEHEEQLRVAREAVQLDPTDAFNHVWLGCAYRDVGDPLSALRHLSRAAEISPKDGYCQVRLAIGLSDLGRDDEALAALDKLARIEEERKDALRLRDFVVERRQERLEWVERARSQAAEQPTDLLSQWRLALSYRRAGRAAEAEEARRAAIEIGLDASPAVATLAWDLNALGYSADAARLAETIPEDEPARALLLAHAFSDEGRSEEAAEQADAAATACETAAQFHWLANVFVAMGRLDDAAEALDEAAALGVEGGPELTRAAIHLAGGGTEAGCAALEDGLGGESRAAGPFDAPRWLCRVLWRHTEKSELSAVVAAVYGAYSARNLEEELIRGFVLATPLSPAQTRRDPGRLDAWCAAWAAQHLNRSVGTVRSLETQAEEQAGAQRIAS